MTCESELQAEVIRHQIRETIGNSKMLTVSILINGEPIITRSAVNVKSLGNDEYEYEVDDGNVITHRRGDGPVLQGCSGAF